MKQPLEQHLTATLEARAHSVRDLPDLGDRVVSRGRQLRRRRRVYGGLAVVVAVATAVATPTLLVDPGARRTPAPPVTTPTGDPSPAPSTEPTPSATEVRRPWDRLAVGPPTEVPYAVGPQLYAGDDRIGLVDEAVITSVHRVGGGYLVRIGGASSVLDGVTVIGHEPYESLTDFAVNSLEVDQSQRMAAWAVVDYNRRTARTRLTLVELPSGSRVSEQVISGEWSVVGFVEEGVVIAQYDEPATPISLWDWATKTVTELESGDKRWAPAHVTALQPGGALLVHNAYTDRCATAALTTASEVPLWQRCDVDMLSAAVSPDGSRVAVSEAMGVGGLVRVLDGATGETLQSWALGDAYVGHEMVWEDARHVLFTISHSFEGGNATALIRCAVGSSDCERVPTPVGGDITALAGT